MILTVSPEGDAQFKTIQEAIDAAPNSLQAPIVIRIYRGNYHEKLHVNKNNLRLIGDAAERVTLTNSDYALQLDDEGNPKNTFLSYTMIVTGNNVSVENMTILNEAGPGDKVGQAVAVYAAGDRISFNNCVFRAHQDTLYCGPTMPNVAKNALPHVLPVQTDRVGDGSFSPCRQYYQNCTIQGDIDFIFGGYTCWFEKCTLICNNRHSDVNGYYTAANTPKDQAHGFIFNECHLTGDGCQNETVYLGRPWRAYAKTAFLNCQIESCVKKEGWQDWNEDRPVTWRYQEYGNYDMTHRHPAASRMTKAECNALTIRTVLSGYDGWNPQNPAKTIYICGDSTAADYDEARMPMTGWGQVLSAFLPRHILVQNEAQCGRSSKSFIAQARLLNIEHCLNPGDILLIQFGHNDEKPDRERATSPYTTYTDYLSLYIDAARQQGACPVLMTPIVRRHFENGKWIDTHGEYLNAMRMLAKQKGVLLIDMAQLTLDLVMQLGDTASIPLWCHIEKGHRNYPDGLTDNTHLSVEGAYRIAKIVALQLQKHQLID